jgi:hypothetical protein
MPEADVPGSAPDRLVQALPVAGCLHRARAIPAAVAVAGLPFEALLEMRVFLVVGPHRPRPLLRPTKFRTRTTRKMTRNT